MATLKEIRQNLKPLLNETRFYRIVLRTASRFEAYLVDLNQLQLSEGKDIFGEIIGFYSEATQAIAAQETTRQPKIAGRPYNFEWTGGVFDGMKIRTRIGAGYIEIYTTDEKYDLLIDTYSGFFGENTIFGLTPDSQTEFVSEKLEPAVQDLVWKTLRLTT